LEFIASSTQTGATYDWFTARIVRLMRTREIGFAEAARLVARDNLTGHGERATRSADLRPLDPLAAEPLRRVLAFAVAHYGGKAPDLQKVATNLGPRGMATRALQGDYGKNSTTVLRDPTVAEMAAAIGAAIVDLGAAAARKRRRGELTLFFDGHGNSAGMEGSDGEMFTLDQLQGLAEAAGAAGVDLIVISNECMQGAGVLLAEQLGNRALGTRVDAAGLPPERAQELHDKLGELERLIEFAQFLSPVLQQLGDVASGESSPGSRDENVRGLHDSMETFSGFDPYLATGFAAAGSELNQRIQAAWKRTATIHASDPEQFVALVRDLDVISDELTEEVARLQYLVKTQLDLASIEAGEP
jgi:hypothetical protein